MDLRAAGRIGQDRIQVTLQFSLPVKIFIGSQSFCMLWSKFQPR